MNNSDRKLPLWSKIFIAVILLLMIIGIFFIIKIHNTYYTYSEDVPPIGLIITIIITGTIAIANVILVGFTKIYADQTTKMVDYYYQKQKDDLKPLFIPYKEESRMSENTMHFLFTNAGNTALFVEIKKENGDDEDTKYIHKVDRWDIVESVNFDVKRLMIEMETESPMVYISIYFSDTLLNKYKQSLKFVWKNMQFMFDKSCLPVELKPVD